MNYPDSKLKQLFLFYFILLFLYLLLYSSFKHKYPVTGDEPHYLVVMDSVINFKTFELTGAYKQEFEQKKIYPGGLAPESDHPTPLNTHGVLGPFGLYSVHNIGLPVLLVPSYFLGGIVAVKVFLIILSTLLFLIFVWILYKYINDFKLSLFINFSLLFSCPFIIASNQIYPDLVAGIFSVSVFLFFEKCRMTKNISKLHNGLFLTSIVFLSYLPWLQIKFAALSGTLLLLLMYYSLNYLSVKTKLLGLIIYAISIVLLLLYNLKAFGNPFGPYTTEALQVSKTSFMVFLGLLMDQNQGIFFQNPILLFSLFGLRIIFKRSKVEAILILLALLSILVPNSMHPNWYGGWSFSGRFQWTTSVLLLYPTVIAVAYFINSLKRKFISVHKIYRFFLLNIILQFTYLYKILYSGVNLYNAGPDPFIDTYSIFWNKIWNIFPIFINSQWFLDYRPNIVWLAIIILLVISINLSSNHVNRLLWIVVPSLILYLIFSPTQATQFNSEIIIPGSRLPGKTGAIDGSARVVIAGKNIEGFLNYGPFLKVNKGNYRIEFFYSCPLNNVNPAKFDIFESQKFEVLNEMPVDNCTGLDQSVHFEFSNFENKIRSLEFRTYWFGKSNFKLEKIQITKK